LRVGIYVRLSLFWQIKAKYVINCKNRRRSVALIIINGCYMKFLMSIPLLLGMGLAGCENTVLNGVGGIPNISFSGKVAGHAKNVQIQAVGIDSNGQPNRDSEGKLLGNIYVTDSDGHFDGLVQGAYTSAYLLVATYSDASTQITCEIPSNVGSCIDGDGKAFTFGQTFTVPASLLRCDIANSLGGCRGGAGDAVAHNETYGISDGILGNATDGFEMWAVVNQIENNDVLSITPVTHLAAKLALSEFVSDGLACDNSSCDTSDYINGMLTAQSIHEANSRVQKLFSLSNSFHVQTPFWTPLASVSSADAIQQVEHNKHGLLVATWPLFSHQRDESLKATLNWWLESFLSHSGQLLSADPITDATKEFDLEGLFASALNVSSIETDNNLLDASKAFDGILNGAACSALLANLTTCTGTNYPVLEGEELLDEKVALARDLVAKVQLWVADLEDKNYSSFFDDTGSTVMTEEFHLMSEKLALFQEQLAPDAQGLFRPISEFVYYTLMCPANKDSCDTNPGYEYKDNVVFDVDTGVFTLNYDQGENLYPKLFMSGSFHDSSSDGVIATTFTFNETLKVETALGLSQVIVSNSSAPNILFALSGTLTTDGKPDVNTIDLSLPDLKVQAKKTDVEGEYQDLAYIGENFKLTMVAATDALIDKPKHFNIFEMDIPGKIQYGTGDNAESIEFAITLISKNAFSFYTGADDEIFPNLDFALDIEAFKQFSQFNPLSETGSVDYSTSQLAGFLQPSSDIEVKKAMQVTLQYVEIFNYSALEGSLQTILSLNETQQFNGLGALEYPGGMTAWAIWTETGSSNVQMARQCLKVSGKWGCFDPQVVSSLGCGDTFGETQSGVRTIFEYFQEKECIQNVTIDGAGIYDIDYNGTTIEPGIAYDLSFLKPITLGLDSVNVRVFSRFKDDDDNDRPVAFFNVLGQILDEDNVSLSISLTHNYQGNANLVGLSFTDLAPVGDHTLWFTMGKQGGESSDESTYYVQDGSVTLALKAFDKTFDNVEPVGFIRYAGSLVATISNEGSNENPVYVIRYANDTWQLL